MLQLNGRRATVGWDTLVGLSHAGLGVLPELSGNAFSTAQLILAVNAEGCKRWSRFEALASFGNPSIILNFTVGGVVPFSFPSVNVLSTGQTRAAGPMETSVCPWKT